MKDWRLKSWPSGITSRVTISIKQSKEDTKITIKQTGVPIKEVTFVLFPSFFILYIFQVDSTKEGWHRYYLQAMKRSFGFGAALF